MQLLDAGFTHKEKKMVLHRYFADDRIRALDLELCTTVLKLATTTVHSQRGVLQSIRSTCIQGKMKKMRSDPLSAEDHASAPGGKQRKLFLQTKGT
ncbi:hypothetical protein KC19_VG226500 [Ceratodon purpureus]|uniref:Uncharacterized protein n=1 Tax=Ceratodon purpureus TaxID=3225 RepID=A0A8T0HT12_CERPU|nr:hypothetical protein KC19_VG226500 [Ceratodon purpureus]